jgi:hypothetical protein
MGNKTYRPGHYLPPELLHADAHRLQLNQQEREVRRATALHEAGHLVAAVHVGGWILNAFVRVPRKTPAYIDHSGSLGKIRASSSNAQKNALITACGIVVESLNPDPEEARIAAIADAYDLLEDEKRFVPGYTLDQVFNEALEFARTNWQAIDGAAAALLHLGRADGVITPKKMQKIEGYIKSRSWETRTTLFQPPDHIRLGQLFDWIAFRP